MPRRNPPAAVMAALLCGLVCAEACAEVVLERERRERPSWINETVQDKDGALVFVGRSPKARSIDEGRTEAMKDASGQAVSALGLRVSNGLRWEASSTGGLTRKETRAYSEGVVREMKVKDVYFEKFRVRRFSFKSNYRVYVLVEVPRAAIEAERKRVERQNGAFPAAMNRLCTSVAGFLKPQAAETSVVIGGFREAASELRHGFARVVEDRLRTCLIQNGLSLAGGEDASWVLTGTYTLGKADVLVHARVERRSDARGVFAKQESLAREAIDPDWLEQAPRDDGFLVENVPQEMPGAIPPGGLSINPLPLGASTYIDGILRGTGRIFIRDVTPGVHAIAIRQEGWKDDLGSVLVKSGETTILEPRLERPTGRLRVDSTPRGARIFLDGRFRDVTPWDSPDLPVGEHRVRLEADNFAPRELKVQVEAGQITVVAEMMTLLPGELFISVNPAGADVLVDDEDAVSPGPDGSVRLGGVRAGARRVCAVLDGFAPRCKMVPVRPGALAQASLALPPGQGGILLLLGWPGEGQIRVDGSQVSPQAALYILQPGERTIEATAKDGRYWYFKGRLRAGGVVRIRGKVRRPPPSFLARALRPTAYHEILGGSIGAGSRLGTAGEIHLFKAQFISPRTRLGLGTTLAEFRAGGGMVRRRETKKDWRGAVKESSGDRDPWVAYLFPLQACFVPYVSSRGSSISFNGTFSTWGRPFLGGAEWETAPHFNSKLLDGGVDVGMRGVLMVRFGYMKQQIPSFTAGEDPKQFPEGRSAHYSGLTRSGFYVAARISLGGAFETLPNPVRRDDD